MTKTTTLLVFFYDINFAPKGMSEFCGDIFDNRYLALIFVLEEKYI